MSGGYFFTVFEVCANTVSVTPHIIADTHRAQAPHKNALLEAILESRMVRLFCIEKYYLVYYIFIYIIVNKLNNLCGFDSTTIFSILPPCPLGKYIPTLLLR